MAENELITFDLFAGRVGEAFELSAGGTVLPAELVEAVESDHQTPPGPSGTARKQFSLIFRTSPEPVVGQQIMGVEHPDLGRLEIFLVPIGPDHVGMRYQAVFA